jgi:hypothetical protein
MLACGRLLLATLAPRPCPAEEGLFAGETVITTAADGAACVYATDLDGDGTVNLLDFFILRNHFGMMR